MLLGLASSICSFGQVANFDSALAPPTREIDLSAWGFRNLAPIERYRSRANVSVHYLDNSHLLLTFNGQRKLMHRPQECPTTDLCRFIHVAVFDLASSKVVAEADWHLLDFRPYLWPLSAGHLLLRRSNSLYALDSELHETLLKDFPSDLLWVNITPDGKQIIAETALEGSSGTKSDVTGTKEPAGSSQQARVKIDFLNTSSLAVERSFQATGVLQLNATSTGYADSTRNVVDKTSLVRFGPSAEQRQRVARVKSPCEPDLVFPANNAVMIGRCSADSQDYNVSVFTVTGHPLWRERWPQLQYFPGLARSEDGSRFAIGTITASREASLPPATDDDHGWPDVEQDIRVFETASGRLLLAARVKTPVMKNPTFAMSPNGGQFALLDGSILRIFDLPAVSADERVKYLAMSADAPGLAPPTGNSSDLIDEGATRAGDTDSEDVAHAGESDLRAALRAASTAPDGTPGLPAGNSTAANAPVSTDSATHTTATEQEPTPSFTFKTSTKEVIVDVLVADSKGHPVKGLPVTDFQIEEDRKPQKIKYFHEFMGSAAAAPSPVTAVKLPPNVFSNNVTPPGEKPLVAVVIDLVNTPTQDQQFAKEQLLKFLRKKPSDMQFAIFALSDGMQILHGFTADENVLTATVTGGAVAGKKKNSWRAYSDYESTVDMSSMVRSAQETSAMDPNFQSSAVELVHMQSEYRANDVDWRVRLTVEGFTQLAQYLVGLPGRKNIVWMSASFPSHFFAELQLDRDTPDQSSDLIRNYSQQLQKMTNLLADAHAAVYPVDVRGIQNDAAYGADSAADVRMAPAPGSQAPAIASTMGSTAGTNTVASVQPLSPIQKQMQQDQESKAAEVATMEEVAKATGGKAFYNTNGIEQAIGTAVEQGSTYYSVSYTSDNVAFDGKFRKLRVSLAQKGYHLTYRPAYFADSPQAPIKNPNELAREIGLHAMQHGAPESRQLAFAVRVVPVGKPAKASVTLASDAVAGQQKKVQQQQYAINYAIAGPQLALTPNGNMQRAVLDFIVTAFNDEGAIISHSAFRSTNDLKPPAYRDMLIGGFRMHQDVDVPANAVSLRLGVFDEHSRHLGTLELPLPLKAPPDDAAAQTRKLPPIEPDDVH